MDEEIEKKRVDILRSMSEFVSFEDELLKLFCLVACSQTHEPHKDHLSKEYLKEKISRALRKVPNVIDSTATVMFLGIKLQK